MNREQKMKLLIVQGMIHRLDIAEDVQKVRFLGNGKGSLISKFVTLYASVPKGDSLLLLTPLLKSLNGQGKVSQYLRKFCILIGAGVFVSRAINHLRAKHADTLTTTQSTVKR